MGGSCARLYTTAYHLYRWYYEDVWDVNGDAHKSIKTIRKLHSLIAKRMNEKTADLSHPPVWLSQFDLAIVQCSQMCIPVLFPEEIGIKCSDDDIMCLLHFWTGIGYLMGMEDRYNLGLQAETLEGTRTYFMEIVERAAKPTWIHSNDEFVKAIKIGVEAVRREANPIFNYDYTINFLSELFGFPLAPKKTSVSWKTAISTAGFSALFYLSTKPVIGAILNSYAGFLVWRMTMFHKGHHKSTVRLMLDVGSQFAQSLLKKFQFWKL